MKNSIQKNSIEEIQEKLERIEKHNRTKRGSRFILSALSNIPWIGVLISASSSLHAEVEQGKINRLERLWLEEHQQKIEYLTETLHRILSKLQESPISNERLDSESYLSLVKKGFKAWDNADTIEKKEILRNLLINAGTTTLCSDDLIRLFISWIELFHDAHFVVLKEIYRNPGITRGMIWDKMNHSRPPENSAEADLFKMLFRDLSTSEVIRQIKSVNAHGQFIKKSSGKKNSSSLHKSAFDDQETYDLTELGKQFVQYVLNDNVTKNNRPENSI